jgi:hypothetical protein
MRKKTRTTTYQMAIATKENQIAIGKGAVPKRALVDHAYISVSED